MKKILAVLSLQFILKMADALVWQLIRENNSFLVKRERTARRGAVQFSKEPGNLLNVNSSKYSGIANEKVINISGLSVSTKVGYIFSISVVSILSLSMV